MCSTIMMIYNAGVKRCAWRHCTNAGLKALDAEHQSEHVLTALFYHSHIDDSQLAGFRFNDVTIPWILPARVLSV
jgi:hypothetical protein